MERRLTVHKKYLCIPVKTAGREEQHLETLEIFQDDNKYLKSAFRSMSRTRAVHMIIMHTLTYRSITGGDFA